LSFWILIQVMVQGWEVEWHGSRSLDLAEMECMMPEWGELCDYTRYTQT
jgi:hypothetical protein